MQRNLSSLDLRAFLRTCHCFLSEEMTLDGWTAFQKFLLLSEQTEFGLYIRQLKKLPPQIQSEIIDGFSNGQIESKLWLIKILQDTLPITKFDAHIMGSWFGLLPRLLSWSLSERLESIHGYDIAPQWKDIAYHLNEPETLQQRHLFFTQDMLDLDYSAEKVLKPTVIINTSCEHLTDFQRWYKKLPQGSVLALQGNNFADHEEHQITWNSLEDFKRDAPMDTLLYEGSLSLQKYNRFMLVGIK